MDDNETWFEKNVHKHKHDFSKPGIYEQRLVIKPNRDTNYQIRYYSIFMCTECHSFKVNNLHDGWGGNIGNNFSKDEKEVFTEEQLKLPRIIGINYNRFCNVNYADEIIFPDNTIWKKEK